MAVAAGMIGVEAFIAGVTIVDMTAHDFGTAELDVLHRLFVAGQHAVAVVLEILRAV